MFSFLKHRPDVPPVGLCGVENLDDIIIHDNIYWMNNSF